MRSLTSLAALAALLLGVSGRAQAPSQGPRLGTFHDPSLVVAYYRSDVHAKELAAKRAEQAKAREAGDTRRVEELEAWGQEAQEMAHRQLSGEASIDNILKILKADLPEVARAAGVDAIVTGVLHAAPGVELVDVTGAMVERFKPDEKTLKAIEEVRAKSAR